MKNPFESIKKVIKSLVANPNESAISLYHIFQHEISTISHGDVIKLNQLRKRIHASAIGKVRDNVGLLLDLDEALYKKGLKSAKQPE